MQSLVKAYLFSVPYDLVLVSPPRQVADMLCLESCLSHPFHEAHYLIQKSHNLGVNLVGGPEKICLTLVQDPALAFCDLDHMLEVLLFRSKYSIFWFSHKSQRKIRHKGVLVILSNALRFVFCWT